MKMRIIIKTTKNQNIIPFDYIPLMVGAIHKWIGGNNDLHGKISLYTFSWLKGSEKVKSGFHFPTGASFFISAHDEKLIGKIIKGAMEQPELFFGMSVNEISLVSNPSFEKGEAYFPVASPVLIKRKEADRVNHYLFSDPKSDELLTETMVKKMSLAGIDSTGLSISFDRNYHAAKTKVVNYNGIKSKGNVCPVIVKGSPEQIEFVWNVGVGNSTGIGFGALN
jgi:CRISPR-associated endoribonuclease Cas6